MKYECPTSYALKVMTNVKVFVHATDADVDVDTRAMTLAPRHTSRLAKNELLNTEKKERFIQVCNFVTNPLHSSDSNKYVGLNMVSYLKY